MARPKTPNQSEIQDVIIERMVEGESLRSICRSDGMPSASTVFRWLDEDSDTAKAFREQYEHATRARAAAIFDDIIEIADDGTNDYVERLRADGEKETAFDREHVQRSRLRVDARKWIASKLDPKKYGDDVRLRHADAEGGKLARDMSESEMAVRMASIFASIRRRHPDQFRDAEGGEE